MLKTRKIISIALLVYLLLLSIIGYLFYEYYLENKSRKIDVASKTVLADSFTADRLIKTILTNLMFSTSELAENGILVNAQVNDTSSIEEVLKYVLASEKYIKNISFINDSGYEVVNINKSGGIGAITPNELLTDVSNTASFLKAQSLNDKEIILQGTIQKNTHHQLNHSKQFILHILSPVTQANGTTGSLITEVDVLTILTDLELHTEAFERIDLIFPHENKILVTNPFNGSANLLDINGHLNIKSSWQTALSELKTDTSGTLATDSEIIAYRTLEWPFAGSIPHSKIILSLPKQEIVEEFRFQQILLPLILAVSLLTTIVVGIVFYVLNLSRRNLEKSLSFVAIDSVSAIVLTDKNNKIVTLNNRFLELSGYSNKDLIGLTPSVFSSPNGFKSRSKANGFYASMWDELLENDVWEGDFINLYPSGERNVHARVVVIRDSFGDITNFAASYIDITKQKHLEKELINLSEKDPLTQCWNRRKFDKEMQRHARFFKRYPHQTSAVLAIIDIDYFKSINDTYGHDKGDEILKNLATCLQKLLRETDIVARIGGEEFALIMPNTNENDIKPLILRVCNSISDFVDINVTVSVGLTNLTHDIKGSYKRADQALYESKTAGRNRISILTDTSSLFETTEISQ